MSHRSLGWLLAATSYWGRLATVTMDANPAATESSKRLRVVDLFAGCGGMSLGLRQAGLDPVAAVERSPWASETYYRNLHERPDDDLGWSGHLELGPVPQLRRWAH